MILLKIIALIALVTGSTTDIIRREVPDLVNFGLIVGALGVRLIFSLSTSNYWIFLYGLFGLLIGVGIAYTMYYLGQWGGGDAKLLMGLGAIIGLELHLMNNFVIFMITVLFVGAVYSLVWSIVLMIKNWSRFKITFKRFINKPKIVLARKIVIAVCIVLLVSAVLVQSFFAKFTIIVVLVMVFFLFYLWLFVKVIEMSSFYKHVKPEQLTEGDWIAKNIIIKGKKICGPKDLGITKKQIKLLKKLKVKRILIKEGIPFVPVFLIAYIIVLIFSDWVFAFI